MTDTVTSQNIDLSSWDTLYVLGNICYSQNHTQQANALGGWNLKLVNAERQVPIGPHSVKDIYLGVSHRLTF